MLATNDNIVDNPQAVTCEDTVSYNIIVSWLCGGGSPLVLKNIRFDNKACDFRDFIVRFIFMVRYFIMMYHVWL